MSRDLTEQVSYLQGLTEGLNINDGGPQGKIIVGILEVLGDIVVNLRDVRGHIFEMNEYMDCIDEDLCELQDSMREGIDIVDGVEVQCANCGKRMYLDAAMVEGDESIEIICPRCNEVVFINDGSFDYEPDLTEDENLGAEPKPSPS